MGKGSRQMNMCVCVCPAYGGEAGRGGGCRLGPDRCGADVGGRVRACVRGHTLCVWARGITVRFTVKKWFANKRARTSNNGLPKPLPPTAPDTPSTASADTSAFVAAAVAAAAAANQSSLLPNGSAGVMMQPQQAQQAQTTAGTKTGSILVPSGLMIRPNGATLAAAALSAGGLTILAPRPPLSSSQPAVVTPSTTSVTTTAITSPKATPSVATEGTGIEVPSVSPSPNATVVEETQQPSTYPICSPSPAHLKKENMEDKVVKEEKDDEDEGKAKEAI